MFVYQRDGKICVTFQSNVPVTNPEYVISIDPKSKTILINDVVVSETTYEELSADVKNKTATTVDKYVTVNLNGHNVSIPTDTEGNGVYHVVKGGTLVIDGEGIIDGVGKNDYNMAIWADGGNVVINSGTFTNKGAKGKSSDHFDLIYAKNGSIVEINGGTFECETPKWTLNNNDSNPGKFVVKGGTFIGYDPSNSQTEPAGAVNNFVADGYTVKHEGNKFTVVKAV